MIQNLQVVKSFCKNVGCPGGTVNYKFQYIYTTILQRMIYIEIILLFYTISNVYKISYFAFISYCIGLVPRWWSIVGWNF